MLNDIGPILNTAKLYGCPPHKIIGHRLIIKKWGILIFIIVSFTIIISFKHSLSLYLNNETISMFHLIVIMRKTFLLICILSDGIISIIKNDKLSSALDHLHVYDVSSKFNNKKIHHKIVNCCRIFVAVNILYSVIQAFLTYYWGKKSLQVDGIIVNFHTAIMSMQILKFCSIMWLLYQRFDHLQKLILPNGNTSNGKCTYENLFIKFLFLFKCRINEWNGDYVENIVFY